MGWGVGVVELVLLLVSWLGGIITLYCLDSVFGFGIVALWEYNLRKLVLFSVLGLESFLVFIPSLSLYRSQFRLHYCNIRRSFVGVPFWNSVFSPKVSVLNLVLDF